MFSLTKLEIAISRVVAPVIPVLFLLLYFYIVHVILIDVWPGITSRIFNSIGINFLFGSTLLLTYDLHLTLTNKVSLKMFGTGLLVFTVVIIFVAIIDQLWFDQLAISFAQGMGLIIVAFTFFVLAADVYLYQKRKSFLY